MLAAVLSIRVKESSSDDCAGRLEDRMMDWMATTASSSRHIPPTEVAGAASPTLLSRQASFVKARPSSPCEMMAFVFMFKSLPVLISPNASNTLVVSAVETVRPYMLQYPHPTPRI
jgi:hypothetical protein